MLKIAKRLTMLGLLAMTTVLGGCGDDDPSGPTTISGTYELESVNNEELPFTLFDEPGFGKFEVLASVLTFESDRTWEEVSTTRTTEGDAEPYVEDESFSGTYTRRGNRITMDDGEDTFVAVVQSNGDLVIGEEGFVARYVKQ